MQFIANIHFGRVATIFAHNSFCVILENNKSFNGHPMHFNTRTGRRQLVEGWYVERSRAEIKKEPHPARSN